MRARQGASFTPSASIPRRAFELCPADACQTDAATLAGVCPADAPNNQEFKILPTFDHPLLGRWQAFLAANDIGVAGVEFIVDETGRAFTYDVNTNTNYNPEAEAKDGRSGMGAIAGYLGELLERQYEDARPHRHNGPRLAATPSRT